MNQPKPAVLPPDVPQVYPTSDAPPPQQAHPVSPFSELTVESVKVTINGPLKLSIESTDAAGKLWAVPLSSVWWLISNTLSRSIKHTVETQISEAMLEVLHDLVFRRHREAAAAAAAATAAVPAAVTTEETSADKDDMHCEM